MFIITLLIQQILTLSTQTVAAPVYPWQPTLGNQTALQLNSAPPWVPQPKYRGSWGILWSCTLTLVLCVYNAIHLNVPAHDEGRYFNRFYLRAFKWTLVALIVPEAVLLFAGLQWYEAKCLCDYLEGLYPNESDSTPSVEKSPIVSSPVEASQLEDKPNPPEKHFPLEYGFYAGMGGFQIDTTQLSEDSRKQIFPISDRMALTTCGIIALARAGVFIPLDRRIIGYKSQVNVITKLLTILQVSWMVIESSARKANGLPLSLLEIHTLVHAFCALIMYMFWFKKPVGVRDPTIADKIDIAMLFGDGENSQRIEFMHPEPPACCRSPDPPTCRMNFREAHIMKCSHTESNINHFISLRPANARDTPYEFKPLPALGLVCAAFVVFGAYAAMHMGAWHFPFPTPAEQYAWRTSCITILIGSLPAPAWVILVDTITHNSYNPRDSMSRAIMRCREWHHEIVKMCLNFSEIRLCLLAWLLYPYFLFCIIFVPLFLCARVIILIESFVSLRKVPEGVYAAVQWTQFFPHI
ncbi:hypothetical protein K440DRAFT_642097 [Wilcoxina mikolae CBS 423.85]|nr:hypothetical protein K440DRAFT_642097 [Wilcoxina mikolae CBS 423.85]